MAKCFLQQPRSLERGFFVVELELSFSDENP
jgi:hypothetical protein